MSSPLIIGVGNDYYGDDGAGLAVVRSLKARKDMPPARYLECHGDCTMLLDAWQGADRVILIDAVLSSADPGTFYRIDALTQPVPITCTFFSTHAFGLAETLALARVLDRLPASLLVYGIVGARFTAGQGLSRSVQEAREKVIEQILLDVEIPKNREISQSGVLYVFDEPTIGLHARDTHRLIGVLRRLRDLGNTVLVIEHDLEMIAAADYVVDFGPGAGKHGGQVVATGTPAEIAGQLSSPTGAYLAGRAAIPVPRQRRAPGEKAITIHGAREHNLQNITVRFPLGLLVAVTGVSGSGKSSLVFNILDRALRQFLYDSHETPGEHDMLEGFEHVTKIITIDQEHIGRVPRSNAATYSETCTPIREAFAATPEASRRGLSPRHFSFNVPGGRCERCEGAGMLTVKMQLLPDVEVRCPACHGRRFTSKTLAVRYHGHDIAQVLDLTVEEALALFQDVPAARSRLQVLCDVGLGYLQLGQPATTLSGGEAQRVKLAKELGRRATGRTLYLLDEPTTGLHLADTARLLGVLQRLVDAGNAVIVVEHNLELVKAADWVIDLGPEGGAGGGKVIAQGTPEQIVRTPGSFTGQSLREILADF